MKQSIPEGRLIATDTETTGLNRWRGDRPFIFSFCNDRGQTGFVEFEVNPYTRKPNYERNRAGFRLIKKFYEDPKIEKFFFNVKFDVGMINSIGIQVKGKIHEVIIAAHNCNSADTPFRLKRLADKYADYSDVDETDLQKAIVKLRRLSKDFGIRIAPDVQADYWLTQFADQLASREEARAMRWLAVKYAMCDAERTMLLWLMYQDVMDDLQVRPSYEFEVEFLEVLRQVENGGAYVNRARIESGLKRCDELITRNAQTIAELGGKSFNPNSAPQKIAYFVGKMKFEPLALTKSRNPQMDNDFLESIESQSPMATAILEHSRAVKAKSTYLENYKLDADERSLIHCSFKSQTATGRLSCTDPNLQNVPVRVPETSAMIEVRKPFGPQPGYVWYLGDYAQIEARIFADEADEEEMMNACRGGDVYTELATRIREITGISITRQQAKTIFLGKIYGLGKKKLIRQLGCGEKEAQDLIYEFDSLFPRAKAYMKETIREVYENGYVWTRYGKRLVVDQNMSYRGVNYKIQGNAAGLMKKAMMNCHYYLRDLGYGRIVLTIHDELIFEFPLDRRPISVLRKLRSIMEDNGGVFRIPTPVQFSKVVESWSVKSSVSW